jgi:hypothetical protein
LCDPGEIIRQKTKELFYFRETLGLVFDPAADRLDGYPETVCRRCASIISNFAIFKKSVESGQEKLRIIAEARKNRLKLAKEAAEADMVPMLLNFFSLSLAVRQTKLECLTRQAF